MAIEITKLRRCSGIYKAHKGDTEGHRHRFYYRCVALLSRYKRDNFCWRFLQVFFAELQKHQNPLKFANVATLSKFVRSYWCISLQKCFHNQKAVTLKYKIDFLKIPEKMQFWVLRTGCLKLKTEFEFMHIFACYSVSKNLMCY